MTSKIICNYEDMDLSVRISYTHWRPDLCQLLREMLVTLEGSLWHHLVGRVLEHRNSLVFSSCRGRTSSSLVGWPSSSPWNHQEILGRVLGLQLPCLGTRVSFKYLLLLICLLGSYKSDHRLWLTPYLHYENHYRTFFLPVSSTVEVRS